MESGKWNFNWTTCLKRAAVVLLNFRTLSLIAFVLSHFHFGASIAFADMDLPSDDPTGGGAVQFDTTVIDSQICMLYQLIQGPYGALLTAVAGVGAIQAAVTGKYGQGYTFLIVGLSCFLTPSFVSLYFGDFTCN